MLDIFYNEFVKLVPAYILKREQDTQEVVVQKSPITGTNKAASFKAKQNSLADDCNFSDLIKIQPDTFELKEFEVFIND